MTKTGEFKLNNGVTMPSIGYGTWQIIFNVRKKVLQAIETGYRLIDSAKIYGNETGVGAAIRDCGLEPEELFVTTKLWTSDQGYDKAKRAFDDSLIRLGLDYIDLYLIHWPGNDAERRKQSWLAMQEIYEEGSTKSIGVSNYEVEHLEEILTYANVMPAVNQIEFHPYVYDQQLPILEWCQKQGIIVEAYSPLARGRHLKDPIINSIADKHHASSAQIMLAWCLHHGTVPIPKSTDAGRMKNNFESTKIKLSEAEVQHLNSLSTGRSEITVSR